MILILGRSNSVTRMLWTSPLSNRAMVGLATSWTRFQLQSAANVVGSNTEAVIT